MVTRAAKLDTAHAVVGLVCIVAVTVTVIVATIRSDRRAARTADELREGARALRGNFDGHQCAPPEFIPPPPTSEPTEN